MLAQPITKDKYNQGSYVVYQKLATDELWDGFKQRWYDRLAARLRHGSTHLRDLSEVKQSGTTAQHDGGLQVIPIRQIRGSEGRSAEFGPDFRPRGTQTRGRWISVARARQDGQSLPPVELVKVSDTYYVRDGNHRISVAAALGQATVEAHVTEWKVADEALPLAR